MSSGASFFSGIPQPQQVSFSQRPGSVGQVHHENGRLPKVTIYMHLHVTTLNYVVLLAECFFFSFEPEAAIVNYYHLDSTLSGHTDHSEKDLSVPLLSLRLADQRFHKCS